MTRTKINNKKNIEKNNAKGNIPINDKLLNKYITIEEIFKYEKNYKINIIINEIKELKKKY